jgi:hypothetical protein
MGRPQDTKTIKSPKQLEKSFEDYKKWAKKHPWYKKDFIRSGEFAGQIVNLEIERPLTEWEFAAFLGMSYRGLCNYGSAEGYEHYFPIYSRIKTEMQAQRISGGLVDTYNANLVARIDGIKEKSEVDVNANINLADVVAQARKRADEPD